MNSDSERLMAASGDYRYWLEEMRHFKPHTLTEPEEKIINIKDVTGASAIGNLYTTLTNRYTFHLTVDGEVKELTRGELMVYARSYDPCLAGSRLPGALPGLRRQMVPSLGRCTRPWSGIGITRTWILRHFSSPMSVRNLANDIPDDVVDTLLGVCQDNRVRFPALLPPKSTLARIRSACDDTIFMPRWSKQPKSMLLSRQPIWFSMLSIISSPAWKN